MRRLFLFLLLAFATGGRVLVAAPARAHDPGLGAAWLRVDGDRLDARLELRGGDPSGAAPAAGLPPGGLGPDVLRVALDGQALAPERARARERSDGAQELELSYALPRGATLRVEPALAASLPGHVTLARVAGADGRVLGEAWLDAATPALEVSLAGAAAGAPGAVAGASAGLDAWFALGLSHAAAGADHVLFLLALLVSCASLGAAARVVTTFTVAHSASLAAAALGLAAPPGWLVEPLIASSIAFAAGLALLEPGASRERLLATFGFGLVHGLGFAGALGGLGLGADGGGVALQLLAFNLGVEAAQLGLAAGALPLIVLLRRSPFGARVALPVASAGAGLVGLVWLFERTLLG